MIGFSKIFLAFPHFLHGTWFTVIIKGKHTHIHTHHEWGQCLRSEFAISLPHAALGWLSALWALPICWGIHSPTPAWLLASFYSPLVFQHKSLTWLARFSSMCCITNPTTTVPEKLSADFILFSFSKRKLTKGVLREAQSCFLLTPTRGRGSVGKTRKKVQSSIWWIVAQYVYLWMTLIHFLILDAGDLQPRKPQEAVMCILCKLYLSKVERKKEKDLITRGGGWEPAARYLSHLFPLEPAPITQSTSYHDLLKSRQWASLDPQKVFNHLTVL